MNELNLSSLFITTYYKTQDNIIKSLDTATGFIVKTPNGIDCLITNRHIVTGTDSFGVFKNKHGCKPLQLDISLIVKTKFTNEIIRSWINISIHLYKATRDEIYSKSYNPLYLEEDKGWIEHPRLRQYADFVAIPIHPLFLNNLNQHSFICKNGYQIDFFRVPYNNISINESIHVSDKVSVVGFPFGVTVSEFNNHWNKEYFPIWTSGYIASEPVINFSNKPLILIDSRTREGNSGSPVYQIKEMNKSKVFEFLGIYSGRINKESDIGLLWKKEALCELLNYVDNLHINNSINYTHFEPVCHFMTTEELQLHNIIAYDFLKEVFCIEKLFQNDLLFTNEEIQKNKWFFYTSINKFKLIGLNVNNQVCSLNSKDELFEINLFDLPFILIKEKYNFTSDKDLFIYIQNNYKTKENLIKYQNFCEQMGFNLISEQYLNILNEQL